jgi:hypothetical protein
MRQAYSRQGSRLDASKLGQIDLSNVEATHSVVHTFYKSCLSMARMTWNGCIDSLVITVQDFKKAKNLTELHLENCLFCSRFHREVGPRKPSIRGQIFTCSLHANDLSASTIENTTWTRSAGACRAAMVPMPIFPKNDY